MHSSTFFRTIGIAVLSFLLGRIIALAYLGRL